jgi:hypothetical protein
MIWISRRTLLRGLISAAAGSAVACSRACSSGPGAGAAPAPAPALGEREREIFEHVRNLLPYLDAEEAMADFARAHVAAGRGFRKQRSEPDPMVTVFLLSTDFFRNGSDVKRPVRFVALYSPLLACSNPFAQLEREAG